MALGIPAAIASGRLMSDQLFGVEPGDPTTLTITSALLALAAFVAAAIPGWRATRVEPVTALKTE